MLQSTPTKTSAASCPSANQPRPQPKPLNKLFQRGRGGLSLAARSALLFCFVTPLRPHDPITTKLTWTREISRIVYKRCGSCHHANGKAMDLTTYDLARPWAKA